MSFYIFDYNFLSVNLFHTFYFSENNMISIFESMSFVFVSGYYGFFFLSDVYNNSISYLFSISIEYREFFSVIYESEPI